MSQEKLFQVGIKALIENQGKFLVVHDPQRRNREPHWDIPGGRIQEGQSAMEALARELKEEIGVSVIKSTKFFTAVISNFELSVEDKKIGLVLMIYKVEVPDSQIKLSDKHDKYEWVDLSEAAKRLAYKYPLEFTNLIKDNE